MNNTKTLKTLLKKLEKAQEYEEKARNKEYFWSNRIANLKLQIDEELDLTRDNPTVVIGDALISLNDGYSNRSISIEKIKVI